MKLPWRTRTEEADPFWEFFINTVPADDRNSVATALRNAPEGAVNPVKDDIHTPEVMSRHVKELARFLGAELTGITRLQEGDHPYAIVCAVQADHDPRHAPGLGGQVPVQNGLFVTFILSAWIRELGYRATAKAAVDNEQLAAAAGLGTLDAAGRLTASALGRHVHVADAILTDLPLAPDR